MSQLPDLKDLPLASFGTIDTTINLKSVGSGNTIGITTGN